MLMIKHGMKRTKKDIMLINEFKEVIPNLGEKKAKETLCVCEKDA